MDLKGTWELNLFDFIQTTTISRRPRTVEGHKYYDTPLRVNVNVQTCQEMELHVSNLLGGRRIMGESNKFSIFKYIYHHPLNDCFLVNIS